MLENTDLMSAINAIVDAVAPMETERISITEALGRVLAEDISAKENVPAFDRSPYDGYAFMASDTRGASEQNPVMLDIIEEIPAGGVSHKPVTTGTAVKILTGAPVPKGADAITKYEQTKFTDSTVMISEEFKSGENIVLMGEDVKKGEILAKKGDVICPATVGTFASQGIVSLLVYKIPKIGIISTGNELVELDSPVTDGKIRNSNRYTLEAACIAAGCMPVPLGIAGDTAEDVASLMFIGLADCDMVISTGGASVGDYDMTPAALEIVGAETIVRKISLKPGGACVYGKKDGKLICGLSGNPASSMINFYAIATCAIRKMRGMSDYMNKELTVVLAESFKKPSHQTRLIRGRLDLSDGEAKIHLSSGQGNAVLSGMIGCDVIAIVPQGSGALAAGTKLKGFQI